MIRELAVLTIVASCPACSLLLDFSDAALPKDASIDSPFTQAECDYKEPNDSLATAAMVALTDTGPAAICPATPDDHDYYRFTIGAVTSVVITMTYPNRTSGDLDLKLYDTTGSVLGSSRDITGTEKITCPSANCAALAAGDYIFEVLPSIQGSVNSYTFALQAN